VASSVGKGDGAGEDDPIGPRDDGDDAGESGGIEEDWDRRRRGRASLPGTTLGLADLKWRSRTAADPTLDAPCWVQEESAARN
jgi:hypothetical protein